MRHKITCATKDRDGVVQTIGNSSRTWTRTNAVQGIKSGIDSFYVQVAGRNPAEIEIYANNYLRTNPDGDPRNNLDNLIACPA